MKSIDEVGMINDAIVIQESFANGLGEPIDQHAVAFVDLKRIGSYWCGSRLVGKHHGIDLNLVPGKTLTTGGAADRRW